MTDEQLAKLARERGGKSLTVSLPTVKARKRNKFGAVRTEFQGVSYHSKAEASRAIQLDQAERAGQLVVISRQVPFWLGTELPTKYVCDFLVLENGELRAEDTKGKRTREFSRAVKAWRLFGKMPLRVLDLKGRVTEIIEGGRQAS